MVHNGIEYGIMAAYAEGLNILHSADVGKEVLEGDAETAPMEHPEYYQYDIDTPEVAEVWRRGSVVGSWLLDLTAQALFESPTLEDFSGRVSDSGEGRWTSIAAIDEGVPAPVLTTALYSRFASRGLDDFADRVLSAMRKRFGGHAEKALELTVPPSVGLRALSVIRPTFRPREPPLLAAGRAPPRHPGGPRRRRPPRAARRWHRGRLVRRARGAGATRLTIDGPTVTRLADPGRRGPTRARRRWRRRAIALS